jgi:hypothetical protein
MLGHWVSWLGLAFSLSCRPNEAVKLNWAMGLELLGPVRKVTCTLLVPLLLPK